MQGLEDRALGGGPPAGARWWPRVGDRGSSGCARPRVAACTLLASPEPSRSPEAQVLASSGCGVGTQPPDCGGSKHSVHQDLLPLASLIPAQTTQRVSQDAT